MRGMGATSDVKGIEVGTYCNIMHAFESLDNQNN